jgi:hypothetical protein
MQTRPTQPHKPNQNHHPENYPNQAKTQPSQQSKLRIHNPDQSPSRKHKNATNVSLPSL